MTVWKGIGITMAVSALAFTVAVAWTVKGVSDAIDKLSGLTVDPLWPT